MPRKDEMSKSQTDRDYPFQVALAADQCSGKNYELIMCACAAFNTALRAHAVRRHDGHHVVLCFASYTDAKDFMAMFGGEPFDPKDKERGASWFRWRVTG